jgi:hypothetical protein
LNAEAVKQFGGKLLDLYTGACFRSGGGVPYSAYRPVFTQCMDDIWRRIYDQTLVSGFIGGAPGLAQRLSAGKQTATQMLRDAGFGSIEVFDTPRPQNSLFLCRP